MANPAFNKDQEAGTQKGGNMKTYIHTVIGLCFMLLFPLLPPIQPITEIGMTIVGIFIGLIYLWTTVSRTWPSLLGLALIGISGFAGPGYAGMQAVGQNAFGYHTVMGAALAMVLFGAVGYYGCSKYIARWFLTRPIINNRPYVFLAMYFLACYTICALTSPIASMFLLWGITVELLKNLKIEEDEKLYKFMIVGTYITALIGQPLIPYKGSQMVMVSAYQKVIGQNLNVLGYMAFSIIMAIILFAIFLLFIKFVYRIDLSKLEAVNVEQFNADPLPPMNQRQKLFMGMIAVFILGLVVPEYLPSTIPGVEVLKSMGFLGITMCLVVVMTLIHLKDGKPVLQFQEVAAKTLHWDVVFLIAAAVYVSGIVTSDATGLKLLIKQVLQPILGGHSEFVFAVIFLTAAVILCNFTNQLAMVLVLLPILKVFGSQWAGGPVPLAMTLIMMVFMSMMTPGVTAHAGMLHGRKDISYGDIVRYALPIIVAALVVYTVIGYPLAKIIF